MTLQYLLFWGMESGLVFLRERRRGVWCRMRAAPVSLGCVLTAKALSTAAIATPAGAGDVRLRLPRVRRRGDRFARRLRAAGGGSVRAGRGYRVARGRHRRNRERARSVSILVILGISMIGGLWVPSFLLPVWVRDAASSLPTSWAMHGLGGVTWQGQGFCCRAAERLAWSPRSRPRSSRSPRGGYERVSEACDGSAIRDADHEAAISPAYRHRMGPLCPLGISGFRPTARDAEADRTVLRRPVRPHRRLSPTFAGRS